MLLKEKLTLIIILMDRVFSFQLLMVRSTRDIGLDTKRMDVGGLFMLKVVLATRENS